MNLPDISYKFIRALGYFLLAGYIVCSICWSWTWRLCEEPTRATWSRIRPRTRRGWLTWALVNVVLAGVLYLATSNTALVFALRSPTTIRITIVAPLQRSSIVLPTLSHLDDLAQRLERMEETVMRVHASTRDQALDTLGKADYALYTSGAHYIPTLTSASATRIIPGVSKSFWKGEKQETAANPWPHGPAMALHHITASGYCWPFVGSEGYIGIKLAQRIFLEQVTIDHIAAELAWDRSVAPRQMHLWGLVDGDAGNLQRVKSWEETGRILNLRKHSALELGVIPDGLQGAFRATGKWIPLASFRYELQAAESIQTFAVDADVHDLGIDFGTVALIIADNWGNDNFTCLYRVRMHGRPSVRVAESHRHVDTIDHADGQKHYFHVPNS